MAIGRGPCLGRARLLGNPLPLSHGIPPRPPQVDCEVRSAEVERVGVDLLSRELQEQLPGDMGGLAESFERLQHSLQQAQDYVDAVVVRGGAAARSAAGQRGAAA